MDHWRELLEKAEPEQHVVQLYGEDDQLLTLNVSRYLAAGLARGDGLLVVASLEHGRAIERQLRVDPLAAEAMAQGRLIFLDARETLDQLIVDGRPDRSLFGQVIGEAVRRVRRNSGSGRVRAFGEMVGLLWAEGRCDAALELEEYWNRLIEGSEVSLFCAYAIDMFDGASDSVDLDAILGAHTHLFAGRCTMLSSARQGH